MAKNTNPINYANRFYGFLPSDVEDVDQLATLALDMRWCWNHEADELWQQLEPELWEQTHNPWIVLQTVSKDLLEKKLADPAFKEKIDQLLQLKAAASASRAWFQQTHPDAPLKTVAYFSMEFMLSEALPIYVGGLGNVAGDQLKSASDLGVPVIAVGLLYQQGYFRQEIDKYGNQQALFPYNDPGQLPIMPLRLPNGEWLRFTIDLAGQPVWLRTWQVQVGRAKLLLLDSNDAANLPMQRGITNEIYGGGPEQRIQQEIILGIGGWRMLSALGLSPEVCHMNEGHAAFVVLERARDFMKQAGRSFDEALAVTRAGNLFTTHTAVAAGFDYFNPALMWQYFGTYAKNELGIGFDDLMALGRVSATNFSENFNMANLAIRGSGAVNGVSKLHGQVSRDLFKSLFPRWPVVEVPVGSVTNGVHTPSWDSEFSDEVWTDCCGKDRWRGNLGEIEANMLTSSDEMLWKMRSAARSALVDFVRVKFERQLMYAAQPAEIIETARRMFDPNILTLGFARRFVPYKRTNLLLYDEERLVRILTNQPQPVQLVIAGKAPPFDEWGKDLIRKWVQFIQRHNLNQHVVFLSDYDMLLTEHLVRGVDVWLNTPRRPWEACGTSGMKVLVNGGLNLSELDGWWAEAYRPEVGWALGDGREHGDDPNWDAEEANALYELLEKQVIPEFYARNEKGIPIAWTKRMRSSMATLTPHFSANRTVREYTEKYYLPAATFYLERAANNGEGGARIIREQHELRNCWNSAKFRGVTIDKSAAGYDFAADIFLNGIDERKVVVELYANGLDGAEPERIKMQIAATPQSAGAPFRFFASVNTNRPAGDYTVRIIPAYEKLSIPLEDNLILWQR
jgi:starch phosphorylase